MKIGIYTSPGPDVCGGYTGSMGHEEEDAQAFAYWGYDYLKYDWCGARRVYHPTQADLQGAYQKMSMALAKTKRPIVFSLCEYGWGDVWNWGAAASGNLWRTTHDISDHWDTMDTIGFAQLDIQEHSTAGHWNDPDMLEVGNGGMTADECRTHMSLWAMLRASLLAGNDIRSMTDETTSILMNKEVIAIDQDPAALPVHRTPPQGTSEVLLRPLSNEAVAVGLFNRGNNSAPISFRWDSLNLKPGLGGKVLTARDLWKHEVVPVTGSTYTATVPPHGVVLIRWLLIKIDGSTEVESRLARCIDQHSDSLGCHVEGNWSVGVAGIHFGIGVRTSYFLLSSLCKRHEFAGPCHKPVRLVAGATEPASRAT